MSETRAAIVTGASRGIGKSVAIALAAAGSPVGLIARDATLLELTATEIRAAGGRATYRAADITDAAATSDAIEAIMGELTGGGEPECDLDSVSVGLLVNAAGRIDREVALWEADAEQWRAIVETNLIGSFNVSRAVIPHMLEAVQPEQQVFCRVIELASGAGAKDWAKASAYTSSKAGLIRVAGHLHEAGYALGVRAFAIAPGTVRTDMSTSMELHAGRTEFTPVSATTDLVLAIHRGELDSWSGKYLRVTHDTPQSLAQYEHEHGSPAEDVRRLAITPWGEEDPQTTEAMVPKRG